MRKWGKLRKLYLVWVFVLLVIMCAACEIAYAHPTQKEHDDELKAVLFGNHPLYGEQQERFQDIADAIALCIDQYSANATARSKEALFDKLDDRIGFSFSFDDVELQEVPGGKNASATNHRKYTHKGWDYEEYPSAKPHNMQKLWEQRKKILTATVNKVVFDKSPGILTKIPWGEGLIYSEAACNEQCDAFCKFVYCVHILGDYLEADSCTDTFRQLIPLVYMGNDHKIPGLITDLISAANILFKDQGNSLSNFTVKLIPIKADAEKLAPSEERRMTQEEFDRYRDCAVRLMDVLKLDIPGMLQKESFFQEVFY